MEKYTLVVSGYGEKEQPTIGYYQVTDEGKVTPDNLYCGYENPSFLEQVGNRLIIIEEKANEAIVSIHEKEDNELKLLDTVRLPGTALCYISYSKRWSIVLGACYGTGDVFALSVGSSGKLSILSLLTQDASEEGFSRAHCMIASPREDYAYGINIASDQVVCYKLDEKGIMPNETFPYLQLPKGEGPRHMKWHPTLEIAYLITEYSNRLFVLQGGKEDGSLEVIQAIDLLKNQKGESYGATICINSEGTILYAANRGMDTITQMHIKEDGTVVYIKETESYGCWPRHIALTQDNKRLLIANQKSGKISMVEVKDEKGELGALIGEIDFPQSSFVANIL